MALLKIANLEKTYTTTKTQKQEVLKGINIEILNSSYEPILALFMVRRKIHHFTTPCQPILKIWDTPQALVLW